ncbi:hypothetical protein PRVXT_000834 [Proteinivorax tanatarense]|uniref:Bypass of forespore C C-terminal domain-containing protein n=1 Tax=Proteinivorax tanatarense TaxID=1260629 RepID=A0AAU7VP43_9FIRM
MIHKGKLVKFYVAIVGLLVLLTILIVSFLYLLPASSPELDTETDNVAASSFNKDLDVVVVQQCEQCGEYNDEEKEEDLRGKFGGTSLKDFNDVFEEKYPHLTAKQVTKNKILIMKDQDKKVCDKCMEYNYLRIESSNLIFYKGHPKLGEEKERLEDIVNFVGTNEQLEQLSKGIPLNNSHKLYMGVFRGKLALFYDKPVHDQPLIQFLDLEVRADAIDMLESEERVESLYDLINILENYAS